MHIKRIGGDPSSVRETLQVEYVKFSYFQLTNLFIGEKANNGTTKKE